jgi:hypothetical protein
VNVSAGSVYGSVFRVVPAATRSIPVGRTMIVSTIGGAAGACGGVDAAADGVSGAEGRGGATAAHAVSAANIPKLRRTTPTHFHHDLITAKNTRARSMVGALAHCAFYASATVSAGVARHFQLHSQYRHSPGTCNVFSPPTWATVTALCRLVHRCYMVVASLIDPDRGAFGARELDPDRGKSQPSRSGPSHGRVLRDRIKDSNDIFGTGVLVKH